MEEINYEKPDKSHSVEGKKLLATWHLAVEKALIVHIKSTPWPCQLDKGGVSIPDNTAQLQHLLACLLEDTRQD